MEWKNKLYFGLIFGFLLSVNPSFAGYKFLVYFTDKSNSEYSIKKPEMFLSEKSILRRVKQGILIKDTDLPVNQKYVDSLRFFGAIVWYTSKWFNAAYVESDTNIINQDIKKLGFVSKVQLLINIEESQNSLEKKSTERLSNKHKLRLESNNYGLSFNQVNMICADKMHELGFKGNNMTIAVMDGGFHNADKVPYFDSLMNSGRILGTYDFVKHNSYVYSYSDHGTKVLSCLASQSTGNLVGTAPSANYYLFRTENEVTEYPVEEANWLIAAEKADSLGVDIINTSLGYSTFDKKQFNYSYADMNGKTTIISKAANMAASVGMLCVVSAGNNGRTAWKYVSAPADADSVLAIGAVDKEGNVASFSAFGPTFDKRVKPDVCAVGSGSIVGGTNGDFTTGNGTSFAAPIMCGMVAGFWQSEPTLTNMEVIEIIRKSGSISTNPDTRLGYGIPCFNRARILAAGKSSITIEDSYIFPNPFSEGTLSLVLGYIDIEKELTIEFFDTSGKVIFKQIISKSKLRNQLSISSSSLLNGLYFVRVSAHDFSRTLKLLKN
jgi:hypothetical protein